MELNLSNITGRVQGATGMVTSLAAEKSREMLLQANLLLQLLQSAGYGIESLELELGISPKITIKLRTGPAVKEANGDFTRARRQDGNHRDRRFVDSI